MDHFKVVVADDAPGVLALFEAVLQLAACEVIAVGDGDAAWNALWTHRPRVAILDLHMPGRSGLEIVRHARAAPELDATRLLVISGDASQEATAAALAAGADRCLAKPVSPAALVAAVRELGV